MPPEHCGGIPAMEADAMGDWYKDTRTLSYEEILLDFVTRLDKHRAGRIACETARTSW